MRSIIVVALIVALCAGAYLSKPNFDAQRRHANEVLAERTEQRADAGDLGGAVGGVIDQINREGKFEDFFVASKYTASSGDRKLLECWGVFSQFICSTPKP
jgi:hypothetical protein